MTVAPATPARERGFTLLEILVALVVFGFLMAGLAQGTNFGLTALNRQIQAIEARGDIDAVDRALRRLVSQLDPAVEIGGRAHAMAFTSDLPDSATAVTTRESDLLLLVDTRHRLVLRWTPHLHAIRVGPRAAPQEVDLLDGIERIDVAYWGESGAGGWLPEWKGDQPPALVRVRLRFPAGDPRHWPDIVVATRRERGDG